ncbi:MAG: serine/threonine protein kinase, partial [Archangium sp.]|nr:serine/threonine protein kinase [Archangium sp.]
MGGTARDDDSSNSGSTGPTTPRRIGSHAEGTVLSNRYRLIRLLGRGGMGEVYEAFDEDLRVRIALKTLRTKPSEGVERSEALEWLKQELRVGRSVAHRNLCRLYDFGSDQGIHFITMELLRGPTLAQHLEELKRPLTQQELAPIVEQICAGLSELHGRDLVHLDIKPSNVVLEEDRVVVTDFGLAALQRETALGGSPWYMAPEQVERKAIDLRADVFALGVLIYEALTRKLPFPGSTDDEIARARLFMRPVELENDSAPRPVRRLISQCLSKDPRNRPQRATDVALRFTLK